MLHQFIFHKLVKKNQVPLTPLGEGDLGGEEKAYTNPKLLYCLPSMVLASACIQSFNMVE
jgi:hypothetical protein